MEQEYDYPDFVETTGYGVDKLGLCGINCYHTFYAFIPGVSTPNYTPEQLEEMERDMNRKRTYRGKEYTKYDATQAMRKMERRMRQQRKRIDTLKKAGGDAEAIKEERAKYRLMNKQYKDFAEKMELPEERERITADGLGRV